MFYKALIVEGIVIIGMVSAAVYGYLPRTEITVGEETYVLKEVVNGEEAIHSPVAMPGAEREHPRPVQPLRKKPVEEVASAEGDLVFPVADHDVEAVISVFGDKRGKSRLHKGIDIKAPRHTPVVAVTDGYVERVREGGSGGKQVYLRDAEGKLYYYAHLEDWSVEEYDAVKAGEELGTVGDSGNARGTTPHLHFEILHGKDREAQDPLPYFLDVAP